MVVSYIFASRPKGESDLPEGFHKGEIHGVGLPGKDASPPTVVEYRWIPGATHDRFAGKTEARCSKAAW